MKRILIFLLLVFSFNAFPEKYNPLLETNKVWTVESSYHIELPPREVYTQFKYQGDTTINNTIYSDFGNNTLLREDTSTHKVYIKVSNEEERLLFDFNAIKGDTIKTYDFDIVIDSVSLFTLQNGEQRKIFYYQSLTSQRYYIEGIGSSAGFIWLSDPIGQPHLNLVCVKQNDIELYGENCDIIAQISERKEPILTLYPNPSKSFVNISTDIELEAYSIYDNSGICLLKDKLENNLINISNFSNGLYYIEFYDQTDKLIAKRKLIIEK